MLVLITKASDYDFYEFKEITAVEDLLKINPSVIVNKNRFQNWGEDELLYCWDGFKKEDVSLMRKAEIEVEIYDDYVE